MVTLYMPRVEGIEIGVFDESHLALPEGTQAHRKVCLSRDPDIVYGIAPTDEEAINKASIRITLDKTNLKSLISAGILRLDEQEEGKIYTLRGHRDRKFTHGKSDKFAHYKTVLEGSKKD